MKIFFSLFFLFSSVAVIAQDSIRITLKQQMLRDWQRAKVYTLQYLDAMPSDKYGFRPVDSVRSFAEQMLHFSQSNAGFAFIGTGIRNAAGTAFYSQTFGKSPSAQTKDSVVYYVSTSYDIMIDAITKLDFAKISETVSWNLPGGKRSTTRWGWLQKAFEHQTHHRGQCTVYLRTAGVHPPNEMLWDESEH